MASHATFGGLRPAARMKPLTTFAGINVILGTVVVGGLWIATHWDARDVSTYVAIAAFVVILNLVLRSWWQYRTHPSRFAANTTLPSSRDHFIGTALIDFGRFTRVTFFVAGAIGLWAYSQSADWSAYETPLGQVTLFQLARALSRTVAIVIAVIVWASWALWPDREAYKAWAYFGLTTLSALALAFLR